jgi:hypothetical protein
MALNKTEIEDKIEVSGQHKIIQVRTVTIVDEDGVELSRSYHRHCVTPADDYSDESAEVQAICVALHTDAVIAAYNLSLEG